MTEQFARSLLKVSVAQICQNVGWHAVQTTPCELLTDILHRYLEELAKTTHRYTAQFGRTKPNVDDLALSFKDINIPLGELEEYVTQVEPVPFAHEIPAFPVYHSNNFQHPKPGSKELLRRPEWVHEHLPALYTENDDIESTPSPAPTEVTQSTTPKRLSCEITSLSDGSLGPIKRPLESPGDSSLPSKRPRLTSDEENCIPREMTSVVMTASGLLSPTREGKLPEAKTPSKIKSLHEESDSSCESPRGLKDLKKVIEHINGILPNKTKDVSEKDKIKSSSTIVKSKPKLKLSSKSSSSKPKVKKKSQSSVIKSLKTSKTNKNTLKSSKDLIRTPKAKSFKSVPQVVSPLQLILSRCDKVKIEKVNKIDKSIKAVKTNNLDKLKIEEIKKNFCELRKEDFKNQAFVKLEKITEKDLIKREIIEVPSREDSPEPRLVIDDDPNRQSEHEKRVRLAALDEIIDAVIKRSIVEVEQGVQMEDAIEAVVRGPHTNENDIDKSDSSLPKTPTISPPPTPSLHSQAIKIKKQKSPKDGNVDKEKKKKPKEKTPKEKLPKEKLPKDKLKDKNKEKLCKIKPDDKNKKIREKIKEKIQSKSGLKLSNMPPLGGGMREENFMHLLPGTHPGLPQSSISPSLSAPPTPRTPHSPVMMPYTSPQMSRGIFSLPTSPHFQQYPFYQHQYQFYSNFQAQNFQSPSQNFPSLSHAHWLAPLAQVRYRSISSPERASPARSPPIPPKIGVGVSPTLQTLTPKSPSVSPRPTLTLDGDTGNFENKEKMKTRDKPPKKKHIKIVNNLRWSGKHLTAKRREHKKDKKKDKNKDKDKDLPKLKKKKDKDKEKDRSKEKEKLKEPKESDLEKVKIKPTKDKTIDKEKEKEKDSEKDHDKDKEKDKEKTKIKDKDKKEGKEKKEKKEGKEKEKDKHKSSKEPPPGATGSVTPSIPKITVKFGGGSTPDVPKIVIKPVLPPEPTLSKPPSPVRAPTPPLVKPPTPKPQTKAVSSPPIPPKINSSIPQPPRSSTPVQRTVITETVGAIVDEGGQKIWICPACTRPDDGSPMIGCDDCDDWYHWICIGIVEAPDEEENWYCPRCQLKKKEQKKKKKKRHRSSHDYN